MALKSCVSNKFESLFGYRPKELCFAPGRVNLIGEHIDYSGFGVLPCAISRYTFVAIGVSKNPDAKALSVGLYSETSSEEPLVTFDSVDSVPVSTHHWSNYVFAAYLGLRDFGVGVPSGIQLVVGGDLPQASGLSSSSSLVVACAMAIASVRLTRQFITPESLAEICMKAEWYVGTAGGGMDQAAIILSKKGYASHIQFVPSTTSVPVELPQGITFIVANSLAPSAKAESAHLRYNKRVFECKFGCFFLRKNVPSKYWLRNEQDIVSDTFGKVLSDLSDPSNIISLCNEYLPEFFLKNNFENIQSLIDTKYGKSVFENNDVFTIRSRALHVYSEFKRVEEFVNVCNTTKKFENLAVLMNESGRSCAEDYECSCPELDDLISIMKGAGCLAARLTGAGWGGCAIGMAKTNEVENVKDEIFEKYFKNKNIDRETVLFSFEPASGAYLDSDV